MGNSKHNSQNSDIVLGLDVGTATTGWAVAKKDLSAANGITLLQYGVITTLPTDTMPERLLQIHQQLGELITRWQPGVAAIESLFFFKNQKTVMSVSQARGVLLLTCQQAGLTILEYTPLQVKSQVVGYGRAEKSQVQNMVKLILNLTEVPKPDDAADAVALCIAALNRRRELHESN